MRLSLLNKLVATHKRFRFSKDTLFLAVNYVDRFLSAQAIHAADMPLVGVVALLIAAKMEETKYPTLDKFATCMGSPGISKARIVEGEKIMLQRLGFELSSPGPAAYFGWAQHGEPIDRDVDLLTLYFLEVTMMDELFVSYLPSFLAAAALNLSLIASGKGSWVLAGTHLVLPRLLIWCRQGDTLQRTGTKPRSSTGLAFAFGSHAGKRSSVIPRYVKTTALT